jgi:hypothetical protein
MEFDSIKHLGVNPDLFDLDKCSEDYDQGTSFYKEFLTFIRRKFLAQLL